MDDFFGREAELKTLQNCYEKKGFQMVVIYGRRRIGKSTLISKFIEDKRSIYFVATMVSAKRNLDLLAKETVHTLAPTFDNIRFPEVEDLFDFITTTMGDERLVLVIDELPFWAEKDEALLSVLQKYADVDWKQKNLLLVLCGSVLSFMQDRVLSEKSPLFGRRTAQIELKGFDYLDTAKFVPHYSSEEKAICYGITGGVPKYLSLLDEQKSLDDNIIDLFFDKDGYLYDETRNLLTQEFSDISTVNAIIEQIAHGENTPRLISDKTHERETTVLYSLEKLMRVGVVGKRNCITEKKNRKKQQYVLADQMFRFWYRFVPAAESAIALGRGEDYYRRAVKPYLHEFMGFVFEDMCRDFTMRESLEGRLDVFLTEVGQWWGSVPAKEIYTGGQETEGKRYLSTDVDVVGLSATDRKAVIGECKFKNEKMTRTVFETLSARGAVIKSEYPIVTYLLFSLSGFSEWFDSDERPATLKLYTLDDFYRKSYS